MIKDKYCKNDLKSQKLFLNETSDYSIVATKDFRPMEEVDACISCFNKK